MNKTELFNKIVSEQQNILLFLFQESDKFNEQNAYIYYEFTRRHIPEIIGFKFKPLEVIFKADNGEFVIQIERHGENIQFIPIEIVIAHAKSC